MGTTYYNGPWNIHITQLLGAKGLLGYIDGKIPKPA